jgi:hypothetical protein
MAVLCDVIGPTYQGVTKNDVLVFWCMEYTFFGLRDKAEYSALQKALLELRNDNTKGPKLPIELERSDAMVADDSRASDDGN